MFMNARGEKYKRELHVLLGCSVGLSHKCQHNLKRRCNIARVAKFLSKIFIHVIIFLLTFRKYLHKFSEHSSKCFGRGNINHE